MFDIIDLQTGVFYAFLYGLILGVFVIFVRLFFLSPVERKTP